MKRVGVELSVTLGREPTDEELSREIGIDRKEITNMKTYAMGLASLDAPMSGDGDTELGEIIGDETARSPADIVGEKNMYQQVDDFLEPLKKKEREVIEGRFGLKGKKNRTLEVISKEF